MKTIETIKQQINDILQGIEFADVNVLQFIDLDDIIEDEYINDSYDLIERLRSDIEDARGFEVEIIYYKKAMQYLMDYDISLCESMELAHQFGFKLEDINSETLASLHASECVKQEFEDQTKYIEEAWDLIEQYRELKEQEEEE